MYINLVIVKSKVMHLNLMFVEQKEKVAGSIPELMSQLRYNVYTKKSKNVEILHLAAEVGTCLL